MQIVAPFKIILCIYTNIENISSVYVLNYKIYILDFAKITDVKNFETICL